MPVSFESDGIYVHFWPRLNLLIGNRLLTLRAANFTFFYIMKIDQIQVALKLSMHT